MGIITALTEFMRQAGGWGVAAMAIYALVRVYIDKAKEAKDLGELLEKRHEQIITMMEESIRLKTMLADLMENNITVQEKLVVLLDRVDRAITSCKLRGQNHD